MAEHAQMQPEWISPPGSILARLLDAKKVDLDDFAVDVGLSSRAARGLIEGSIPIDESLAERLAAAVGSTPAFWMRCESNYRNDIERNMHAYVDEDVKEWMKQLPLKEFSELGWIKRYSDPIKQAEECFKFFGVIGLDAWRNKQASLLSGANFRTSKVFRAEPDTTAAWLRWAEDRADQINCGPWNRGNFSEKLQEIRSLSRLHHPERFVPKLREICASVGVALVIAPAPTGCRASGATKLIRQRKAMIVLSFRFYSDDQFWFTFFHEAAHLIRHLDQKLFVEGDGGEFDDREDDANQYALDLLIPRNQRDTMYALKSEYTSYITFARSIGIAPGIVVGQMQRLGRLPYQRLNKLKRRFEWKALYEDGIIL